MYFLNFSRSVDFWNVEYIRQLIAFQLSVHIYFQFDKMYTTYLF